jgi:hypothetical protein
VSAPLTLSHKFSEIQRIRINAIAEREVTCGATEETSAVQVLRQLSQGSNDEDLQDVTSETPETIVLYPTCSLLNAAHLFIHE